MKRNRFGMKTDLLSLVGTGDSCKFEARTSNGIVLVVFLGETQEDVSSSQDPRFDVNCRRFPVELVLENYLDS